MAQQLRQPQPGDLQQFLAHDRSLGLGVVAEPGSQLVQHLLSRQAAGADEEHVAETPLVGEVAVRERLAYLVAGGRDAGLLTASMRSSQLNALKTASTAVRRAVGPGYGRPSVIALANDPDAQHPSRSRSAASGEAALKAASVDSWRSGLTMRNIQSGGAAHVVGAY